MDHRYFVFCIPPLMVLDYLLTVAGATLGEKTYRLHFKFPDYELNPLFRKHIAQKRKVSILHLAAVALMTAFSIFWFLNWAIDDSSFDDEMLLGMLITVFMTVTGNHLANLLTFRFLNRHPDAVSGEVMMSQSYILNLSRYRLLAVLLPIGAAAIFARVPFLYGALIGISLLFFIHWIWAWRESRKLRVKV